MKILLLIAFLQLVYEIQSWCLRTVLSEKFEIVEVDWAPDHSTFVTANVGQQKVRIYNAKTFEILKVYSPANIVTSVKISKDSKYVAIGTKSNNLIVLNNVFPYDVYMTRNTGHSEIAEVDFTYDNISVMSCGKDQRFNLYSLSTPSGGNPANFSYKFVSGAQDATACRCGPNGDVAFGDIGKRLQIHLNGGTVVTYPNCGDDVIQIDFVPGTSTIGSIALDNIFRWNSTTNITNTGDVLSSLSIGKQGIHYALTRGKTLHIYDRIGSVLVAKFVDHKNNISSVKLSSDQTFLITGDISGQIRVYSTKCGMFGCQSGYYNASNVCKKCSDIMSFCISCKSASACQNCMAGYFKSGSGCAACYTVLDSCLSCKDSTQCLKCFDGYYLDSTTKKCVRCSLTGCIQCNTSAICTKCFKNDFYLNTTSNTCTQCADTLSNCVRCYDSNTCVECHIGFYEDTTTKKCVECAGNCVACQSSTNCTQCKVGYWASGGSCIRCTTAGCISCNQTGVCYDCKQGMFLTGTNTCTACTIPCASCSVAATNCTGCNIGYYFDSLTFKCLKCIENCKICNESTKCLSCFPGFKVDGTSFTCKPCSGYYGNCSECSQTLCLKCRQGFYSDTTAGNVCKTCISMIPNCMNCANSTGCTECITSYYPTGVAGPTSCAPCAAGCQECISATNCTNCFPTFFKNTSLLCEPCKNKCFECSSDLVCLSCVVGYYLDTTTCKACQSILAYCSACTDSLTCITCMPGAYLDSADNKCKLCSLSNCLTCNKTFCFSCEVGYYLDTTASPNICKECSQFCQQCTSATVCTSCIDGYYFDSADNKCKSCASTFPHCTLCNKTMCLQCDKGTQLNLTNSNVCSPCANHITNCKTCFWDNTAAPVIKCTLCNYGYGLASTNLTCPACSLISGCIECKSATLCTKCEIGFYLKPDNTCGLCKDNCLTCNNALTCLSCRQGYVNDTTNCVLCQTKIDGCSKCLVNTGTTYNCSYCQISYYLSSTDKQCYLCHNSITGCYTCNDSSTCTACLDKYYLDTTGVTGTCKKCVTNIPGCQLCNSSSVCISCQDSYYLNAVDHKCYYCSNNIPGCLHCKDNTVCSQCESGYYLTAGNICSLCESVIQGCIYCNSQTYCIQCRTGYYLNTADNKCYKCSQSGCQVCSYNSPSVCITCNSKYYLVGTTCNTCRSRVTYCGQCNSTECLSCDVGYYLASPTVCSTCSSAMSGCSRCVSGTTCLECMSSYFVNSTYQCQQCNNVMFGCQNCIDGSTCISCEANFFLNSTTNKCQPCTDITGCMLCRNQTTCVMCQQKYYMSGSQCLLCSTAMKGCFSCVSENVCVQCQSGYVLDAVSYACKVNTVEAKQAVEGLKLVTYYISKYMLKHVLLAKGTNFKKSDTLNITQNGQTTMFVEDYTGKQVQLNVLSYEFGSSGNSIIFYTDNPLSGEMEQKSKKMQFRRLLVTELNLQVMVKMNQDVYRQILPELDYSGSMTVGYSLNNPEFMNSYMAAEAGNKYLMYEIVGMVAICLFLLNYVIKFLCTMPQSKNRSTLLPHIIALKSCCLILYPSHFEYISFCKGFMVVDFPWLNSVLATMLTDQSDNVQVPFGLFFLNMSIAGTFLLGFAAYIALVLLVHAYFYITKEQPSEQNKSQKSSSQVSSQQERKKQKQFKIQNLQLAMGINYDNDESQTNKHALNKRNFLQLLWNIFTFSMAYYSCLSVQGAFFNYSQMITINGVFYIIGMLMFIYVTIQTFYAFIRNFKNISKVRIYLKACLLSLAHFNPIYIVSVCVILDMLLAVMQFYVVNKPNQFSKFFVLTHFLSSMVIGLMIFVSGSLVSLFSTAISLVICFGFQVFIHIKEYKNANKSVQDEEFKMEQDDQKQHQEGDQTFNRSNNVWDLGRKPSAQKNSKSFKDIDMYATMQVFDKANDKFDMQNVEFGRETGYKPQTSINANNNNKQFSQTQAVSVKQGGRRNKQRKTQQAFRSNVIEIVPNPKAEQKERKNDFGVNMFSFEEMDSNSP